MGKNNERYYTLRYEHSDGLHKAGDRIVAATETVRIGQQQDCDVRFGNPSDYADELFAIIRPCCSGDGWQLVQCSQYVKTSVNGTEQTLVHYLKDGDRISFSGMRQELLFTEHDDGRYAATAGTLTLSAPMPSSLVVTIFAVMLALFGGLGAYFYKVSHAEKEVQATLAEVKPSVLQISVDSVLYVEQTAGGGCKVIKTYSYAREDGHCISGTAFLTEDSLLVTARHCIEPWLNDASVVTATSPSDVKSLPTRWAMEAETYNQMHEGGDTTRMVVSVCDLYRGEKGTEMFKRLKSTDFAYDNSRDDIVEGGDYRHVYFWRSISPGCNRFDMMLGDLACAKMDVASAGLTLATAEQMRELVSVKRQLHFVGFPLHSYSAVGIEVRDGEVQLAWDGRMIAHNGALEPGFSGAPVIVVSGKQAIVVGVLSITDKEGDRMYSVPVTELKKERRQHGNER